jgi:Cu/Ag efflux pump CusA
LFDARGENPTRVLANVKEAEEELNKPCCLPAFRWPFYDRQHLVDATDTVSHSVLLGITLVVLTTTFPGPTVDGPVGCGHNSTRCSLR